MGPGHKESMLNLRVTGTYKVCRQAWLNGHVCNTMSTTDLTQHLLREVSRFLGSIPTSCSVPSTLRRLHAHVISSLRAGTAPS